MKQEHFAEVSSYPGYPIYNAPPECLLFLISVLALGGYDNPPPGEIVGMELELDLITRRDADEIQPVIAGSPCDATMAVGQLNTIGTVFEDFDHGAPRPDLIVVGHWAGRLETKG